MDYWETRELGEELWLYFAEDESTGQSSYNIGGKIRSIISGSTNGVPRLVPFINGSGCEESYYDKEVKTTPV